MDAQRGFGPAEPQPGGVCLGRADEGPGLGLAQTLAEVLDAHARIHHHRNRTDFEQGEGDGEKLRAWRHHQNRAHALGNSGRGQGVGRAIAQRIELSRRQASVATALVGHRDGQRVGLLRGHYRQPRGDVAGRAAGRAHGVGCSARNVVISGMLSSPASSSM